MSSGGRLLALLAIAAGCTAGGNRPVQPMRPPSNAELNWGHQEATDEAVRYLADKGLADAEHLGTDQPYPNLWRVRFGLSPDKHLLLYFDGVNKTLIKEEEIRGIQGGLIPDQNAPPPQRR